MKIPAEEFTPGIAKFRMNEWLDGTAVKVINFILFTQKLVL